LKERERGRKKKTRLAAETKRKTNALSLALEFSSEFPRTFCLCLSFAYWSLRTSLLAIDDVRVPSEGVSGEAGAATAPAVAAADIDDVDTGIDDELFFFFFFLSEEDDDFFFVALTIVMSGSTRDRLSSRNAREKRKERGVARKRDEKKRSRFGRKKT
jgi:hypothetical protein